MKKTIQINIGGRHFHMDEDAFHKLNHYLESLKSHFASEGDTGKEIMEDIEQRIAELLEKKITGNTQAISLENVDEAIGVLGKVEDFVYAGTSGQSREHDSYGRRENRRLYRDEDSNYLGGVAAGLGAYFDIDVIWIRLAFVALLFLQGLGILIYAILWIVVPKARTTAEKLQMRGIPVTLSTIRESVNAEYNRVKAGLNNLGKSAAADRTRNILESLIRAVGLVFMAIFKIIIGFIGVFLVVMGALLLTGLLMFAMGFTHMFGHFHVWNGFAFPHFAHLFASTGQYYLIIICLIILVVIPIIVMIYWGIKIIFNIRSRHRLLRASLLIAWIVAFAMFITLVFMNAGNFAVEANTRNSATIENKSYPRLYLEVRDNAESEKITHYTVFDHRFNYNEEDNSLYTEPRVSLIKSHDQGMYAITEKYANNIGPEYSREFMERIRYNWEQKDSMIYIDRYLNTNDEDFWMFPRVSLDLQIPEGQVVILSDRLCSLLDYDQQNRYCNDSMLTGKPAVMTADGLMLQEKQKTGSKRSK